MTKVSKGGVKRLTIRFTVFGAVILAALITATIAITVQYYFSKNMATQSAEQLFNVTATSTGKFIEQVERRTINTVRLLSSFVNLADPRDSYIVARDAFIEVMLQNPLFYSIHLGFANGDFFGLVNLEADPSIRSHFKASTLDRWVGVWVKGQGSERQQTFYYLDADFITRVKRSEPTHFNSTQRPWYANAQVGRVVKSEPYLFQQLQSPGESYSIKLGDSGVVLAIDIVLSSLSDYLLSLSKQQQVHSDIYLYNASGEIIATNDVRQQTVIIPSSKPLTLTAQQHAVIARAGLIRVSNETNWPPIDFAVSGMPQGYSIDVLELVFEMTGIKYQYINGFSWPELINKFKRGEIEILNSVMKVPGNQDLGIFSQPLIQLPFSLVTQGNIAPITHMNQLKGQRLAIPAGWALIEVIRDNFPYIDIVEFESTRAILEAVADGQVYAAIDNGALLHFTAEAFFMEGLRFHDGISFNPIEASPYLYLVMDKQRRALMDIVNLALANISPEQMEALKQKWFSAASNDHVDIGVQRSAGIKGSAVVPYSALIKLSKSPKLYRQLLPRTLGGIDYFIYVTPIGSPSNVKQRHFLAILVPKYDLLAASLAKVVSSIVITIASLVFILPFFWVVATPIIRPINDLLTENNKIKNRQYDEVKQVNTVIQEVHELAGSLVEMAGALRRHEEDQQALMDAIIQLIAQAIDDKSAYTAAHCNRVPVLALMLAEAAESVVTGPFRDFCFKSENEYREFQIAAWLHDCGKITTPEHIVDKGSKLEVIYNRIHEIRMRFEVLWRDAEIDYLTQLAQAPDKADELKAALTRLRAQLSDDFTFIASANIGSESMKHTDIERLNQLAKLSWQRNFDDRLGLSPFEESHIQRSDARNINAGVNASTSTSNLPVTESLLANKPEHIFKRAAPIVFDPKFNIEMDIPQDLYNLGELYNLSIRHGTLTVEDRFKINEHIISTIKMLDKLPFPREMSKVPRYASTHHETLIGSGYPRKLTGDDLSIPERVLVIADIFEALTAEDRPYKKANSVSDAVDILHKMALREHLDMDLFKLFLSSGVYLEYAHKFLDSAQIDEVDINKYL